MQSSGFDSILAFGDSFVAGAELDGPTSSSVKDKAFPAILGRMLQIPVYNFGWSGGSNQRSVRILAETLLAYPNSLVLFFYTDHARNEYFRPDLPSHLPEDPTGYSPLGPGWDHSSIDMDCRKLNRLYYENFYHDTTEYNNYREYNMLLQVQLICEKYSKDYVQIFGFPGSLNEKVNSQQSVLAAVDRSKILRFPGKLWSNDGWNLGYGNLIEWVKESGYPTGYAHMLHEGHQALANLLLEHLKVNHDI
jgi:hypothetical protein